ncbi:MAG TPA: hypothetical protein VFL13_02830 [Candidatus Baltobacteraceae bacterium]|nr:hypothetical protein [Candidatus Baltobacteraceae bacterium]
MKAIGNYVKSIAACAIAAALLSGCATNGAATIPSTSQANLNSNVLQFAVGTANINGTAALNTVATLRQTSGNSGVLADQPTIAGPAGFVAGSAAAYNTATFGANVDAGTTHISGSPQVPRNNAGLVNSTLGTFTGVFSYGFGPYNCDTNCTNLGAYYPGNPNSTTGNGFLASQYACSSAICANSATPNDVGEVQPFYAPAGSGFDFIVGPPAVPFFNDGTFPSGFAGYPPGFTTFAVTPMAGAYQLSVNVAAQNASPITYTASSTLTSTALLGPISVAITGKPSNGLTGTVSVPAGVTETEVFAVDVTPGGTQTFFTAGPISGTGTKSWSIPGNLGPCAGSNCQSGANAGPSFSTGDIYFVVAVGYDYPAFEAGPPGNKQQKPTITGAGGQADLTMSDPAFGGGLPY